MYMYTQTNSTCWAPSVIYIPRGSYDPDSRGPCNDLTFERTTLICVVAVLCVAHLIF